MDQNLQTEHHQTFEGIKKYDPQGREFWYARALSKLLGYADFRNFQKVIEKAKIACQQSGYESQDHLVEVTEVVKVGSGAEAPYPSYALSQYACYLVVQNADPTKPIVASDQKVQSKEQANQTHYEVGKTVGSAIQQLGGTMPEDLPTPVKSIKQIENTQPKNIENDDK